MTRDSKTTKDIILLKIDIKVFYVKWIKLNEAIKISNSVSVINFETLIYSLDLFSKNRKLFTCLSQKCTQMLFYKLSHPSNTIISIKGGIFYITLFE
jgi:hypothetical protein